MFRASSCPSSEATTAVAASGLPSKFGDSKCWSWSDCHQDLTVNQRLLATAGDVAPDGGHEDARNMLSCI
jgi:hypothetical protein